VVSAWDPRRTARHAGRISGLIADGAQAMGLQVVPEHLRSPHLLGIRLDPTVDAEAVAPALADLGVHLSVRGDAIRVSVHGFNTVDDAHRLLESLSAVLERSP